MSPVIIIRDLTIAEKKTVIALIQDVSWLGGISGSVTDYDTNVAYSLPAQYPTVEYELYFRVNTKELVLYAANPHGQTIKLDAALYFDE